MSDPIRAALEAAARRLCICDGECFATRHGMMHGPCEQDLPRAAAAVAAFLRVIARQHVEDCDRDGVPGDPMGVGAWLDDIAAAAERAAREGE